jgi:hypothetical protein
VSVTVLTGIQCINNSFLSRTQNYRVRSVDVPSEIRTLLSFVFCSARVLLVESRYDRLRAGRLGFDSRQRKTSSPQRPDRPWGPPGVLSTEYQGLFTWGGGFQRQGCEAHHSPSSAEVKKVELYLHSPICLHGTVLN